jgi:hypothetical protein
MNTVISRDGQLALHEPPFGTDDDAAKQEMAAFAQHTQDLLAANQRGEAVAFFLADMVPPDVLERMRQSPEWLIMAAVAHTVAYDNAVMGDGAVPVDAAKAATMPALVIDGSESPDFKHEAADSLARAMPRAQRLTLEGQSTQVPPAVLAPVLKGFFGGSKSARRARAAAPIPERTRR